jgi:PAS domain S-box-containing protein
MVEDSHDDVDLVLRELRRAGYDPQHLRVDNAEDLRAALVTREWDLVMSDHAMPGFSSLAALAVLRETHVDLPFLIVSGSIGEQAAVDGMRAGANDYLMKGNLARLGPVVDRELREAASRRERRETERALREAEEVFRTLSICSPLGIFMTDVAGHYRYVNPHYRQLHGLTLMESLGAGWLAPIHPDDQLRVRVDWEAFIFDQGRSQFAPEYRVKTRSTDYRWMQMRAFPTRPEKGSLTGFVGTVEDITERKQAEDSLRRREREIRTLADNVPDIIARFDRQLRHLYVNDIIRAKTGKPAAEFIGKTNREMGMPSDYSDLWEAVQQQVFETAQAQTIEFEFAAPDGLRHFESRVVPELSADGSVETIVCITRDITERKILEGQFRQAQKMEAVGQLAGGIAHDFNNILTAITGYTELTLRRLESGSPFRNNLEQVRRAADRAASLTRQLLAFSRKQTLQPKVIDLNSAVDDIQKMLRRLIGENIELITKVSPNLRYIKADPGQIEQVILNLVVNARDAMPNGGKLSLETANVTFDADAARLQGGLQPGAYVMLAVSDTGCGMTEAVKLRVFEPFFTTKPAGQGTGLGLATCYGIVTQSGGQITVETELDRGSTFRIYLPSVERPPEGEGADAVLKPVRGGTELLLLVEDDPPVRAIAVAVLRSYGYTVWEASDGQEALVLANQPDASQIAMVVTDVVMPRMGGKELADRVRDLLPQAKILFTSGYTENVISHQGVLDEGINYLHKPYTPSSLARKVRDVLDGVVD